jgi:deoxyhypusine synthase
MSILQLTEELKQAGVIGAGKVGKAVDIVAEMFSNPNYTTFITLSGPLVPGGLRLVFVDLIKRGYVDAVMTNGANIVHDLIEAMGNSHFVGTTSINDVEIYNKGFNRVYDVFIENQAFIEIEDFMGKILDEIPEEERRGISFHKFLREVGLRLNDEESILYTAARENVPIFSPGFLDSMLGIPLWMYSRQKILEFSPLKDFDLLSNMVFEAKKSGAIILGGGIPKHHTQYLHTLKEGLDAAVQITTARSENGSLSGAPLRESISWGKLQKGQLESMTSTIFGDITIIFPIIIAAVLEKIS